IIARSCALISAGLRYTDERGTANNRHCRDIGSTGFRSARLSCRAFVPKIVFDLQLADLPIEKIDLHPIRGSLHRSATREDARRAVQQLLLPVVDLVRV